MDYLTASQAAKKWNISRRRVDILCREGRIYGAVMMGDRWVIPKDAEKPEDRRRIRYLVHDKYDN